jgi:hypothetical protein
MSEDDPAWENALDNPRARELNRRLFGFDV